jgi:uncharacterized membrane protein
MEYIQNLYAAWLENGLTDALIVFFAVTILGVFALVVCAVVVVVGLKVSALVVAVSLAIVTRVVVDFIYLISQYHYKKDQKIAVKQYDEEKKVLDHEKRVNEVVWGNRSVKK